jgi:hypothetical protein
MVMMMVAIFWYLFPWLGWDNRHEKNSLRKNLLHPNLLKDVCTWRRRRTITRAPPTSQQA